MMGSSSSLPANDSYIKTTPYPSQGKEQPFMYQQNYGSLIRKNLVERSRTYIDDKTESQHSDYGLKDLEITEMKDGSWENVPDDLVLIRQSRFSPYGQSRF